MSARSPRRSFAAPFVVTLVPSLTAACYVETRPAPAGPPATAPTAPMGPTEPAPTSPPAAPTEPAPPPPIVVTNPPPPTPSNDFRWTIKKQNGQCTAWLQANCPTTKPGEPQLACNPPPPKKVTCPEYVQEGGSLNIVRYAGRKDCMVDWGPINCPPNATCNPPPPRKVACP